MLTTCRTTATRSPDTLPSRLPRHQGYDAFLIATIPDTGFEEIRTLVDLPVVTFGQT